MYHVEILAPFDVLDAIDDAAKKAPGLMKTAYNRALRRLKPRILRDLQNEPPVLSETNYPLRWKSAKQRRYVMAMLRRTDNLPYRRTHELRDGWEVNLNATSDGGILALENDAPATRYVQGDDAQPMHLVNGWPQAADIVVKYEDLAEDILIDTWAILVFPEF